MFQAHVFTGNWEDLLEINVKLEFKRQIYAKNEWITVCDNDEKDYFGRLQ